jgi:predicted glycosyltransferase
MPLITRRSSARSGPVRPVGKCGSISDHCSSLSQNNPARIIPLRVKPRQRESHSANQVQTLGPVDIQRSQSATAAIMTMAAKFAAAFS